MSRPFSTFRQLVQASHSSLRQSENLSIRLASTKSSAFNEQSHSPAKSPASSPDTIQLNRPLSTTTSLNNDHRRMHPDDDRSSINTERSEYTNSGTDNEVASQRSAFDPKNIDPDQEAQASGEEVLEAGDVGNPLEVSPANREVSRTLDPMEGGAQRGMDRGPSQRFSPRKGTKVSMAGWTGGGGPPPKKGGKDASGSSGGGSGGKGCV